MHTSGVVITLGDDPALAKAALIEMAAVGPFSLGEAMGPCQAAVLEVADARAAQEWHDWAADLPGVESLEVVFVHWDESEVPHHDA